MIKTWQKKPENGGNTRNRTLHLLPGQKGLKGTTFGPGYPGTPGHLNVMQLSQLVFDWQHFQKSVQNNGISLLAEFAHFQHF